MAKSGASWGGVGSSLPLVCLTLLLLAPTPAPAGIDWGSILGSVVNTASKTLYKHDEIILYDRYCTLSRRPYIKRWELHYRSSVYCPGWTSIVGKAENDRSPTNSERKATQDFVRQAVARDIITQDQAKLWI